ncbi:MAG TPA: hypothetical protein VK137_08570, partial [Planctomycetaceae bacterium]|nr:hypothetical protein [Planctomycetaceae bacterium]
MATGVLAMLCSLGCDRGQPDGAQKSLPAKPIKIVVSGDTQGWIVPCGCTSNQSGGLPRRGRYVAELRQSNRVLLFDVGGAASGSAAYDRAKFEAILKGELLMTTAAHNLGESELKLGVETLRDVANRLQVRFVSANTTDETGKPIVPPGQLMQLVSSEVMSTFLVVGVVSPRYATAEIRVSEPHEAILRLAQ